MSCERNTSALADVAAGRAPSAGLQAHLDACAACRATLGEAREALAVADDVLGALASAEPAPELRARIRQAAAAADADSTARRWSPARWALAAGCAALVLAALVAGWERSGSIGGPRNAMATPQPTPKVATPSSAGSPGPATAQEPTLSGQSPREARGAVPVRRHGAAAVARRAEPEVLVPPGEQQALLQLVALAGRDSAVPPNLRAAGQPSPDLAEPAELGIKPLEIVPLDRAETPGT